MSSFDKASFINNMKQRLSPSDLIGLAKIDQATATKSINYIVPKLADALFNVANSPEGMERIRVATGEDRAEKMNKLFGSTVCNSIVSNLSKELKTENRKSDLILQSVFQCMIDELANNRELLKVAFNNQNSRRFANNSSDNSRRYSLTPSSETEDSGSWVYWLLPALILSAVALYLLPKKANVNKETTVTISQPGEASPNQGLISNPEVAKTVENLQTSVVTDITKLRTSLQTIKDAVTANSALKDIREVAKSVAVLKEKADTLSPDSRKALGLAIKEQIKDYDTIFTTFNALKVGGDVQKEIEVLQKNLDSLINVTS